MPAGTDPSQPHRIRSFGDWLRIVICGMCMGATEMIPGVSGGTTAFILGIWHDLLDSIKSFGVASWTLLFRGRFRKFSQTVRWRFLLAVGIGNIMSLVLLVQVVAFLLGHESYRSYLYGGFLGLIVASIIFCGMKIKHWNFCNVLGLAFGALTAYALTSADLNVPQTEPLFDVYVPREKIGLNHAAVIISNYDAERQMLKSVSQSTLEAMIAKSLISPDTLVYNHAMRQYGRAKEWAVHQYRISIDWQLSLFGALAIIAMLLPGISGSYVLVILGKYAIVVGALADFVSGLKQGIFEQEAFFILFSLFIGVVIGALLFARTISYFLRTHYHTTLATLTGFMLGSLPAIWPFWSYSYVLLPLKLDKGPQLEVLHRILPEVASIGFWIVCLTALIGVSFVFIIEYLARRQHSSVGS